MELLASLPVELAAVADPSARGAAPLLRPPGAGGPAPPPVLPFELVLDLLAEAPPGGESWPANGKELPLPPLEPAEPAALSPALFLMSSVVPAHTAPQEFQTLAAAASQPTEPFAPAAWPTVAPRPTAAPLPLPLSAEPPALPSSAAAAAALPFELEALAPLVPADAEASPLEGATTRAADGATNAAATHAKLDAAFFNDAPPRTQAATALSAEKRAAALATAPPGVATNVQPALPPAYVPRTQEPAASQGRSRPLDAVTLTVALGATAEAPAAATIDWLPPTGAYGTPSAGGAAPAPALPSSPVDVRTPGWQEAFASRVQWIVDADVGEARIKLNPPELGAIDVKVSLLDDKTYVQLTTATAAARDELAQSLPRLRELFTAGGLELGGASVHNGREQRQGDGGYAAGQGEPRGGAVFIEPGDALAARAARGSAGRIDVFA